MQSANELHFCNEIICALFSDKRENGLKNLLKFAYSFGFFNLFFSLMFFGAEFAKSFDLFFSFYKLNDIGAYLNVHISVFRSGNRGVVFMPFGFCRTFEI